MRKELLESTDCRGYVASPYGQGCEIASPIRALGLIGMPPERLGGHTALDESYSNLNLLPSLSRYHHKLKHRHRSARRHPIVPIATLHAAKGNI